MIPVSKEIKRNVDNIVEVCSDPLPHLQAMRQVTAATLSVWERIEEHQRSNTDTTMKPSETIFCLNGYHYSKQSCLTDLAYIDFGIRRVTEGNW